MEGPMPDRASSADSRWPENNFERELELFNVCFVEDSKPWDHL